MKHKNLKNLPLKGIKVLDAASYIAAPLVSALMTDYGAEVIKIESHTGDTYRDAVKGGHVWPESEMDWAFILENRNKRSLSIDLKTEEGQIILKKLVKESDVLITNMPGEPRKKLGLDESKIRKMNKKIIYASLTAYGEKGPDSKRTAFDATAYYARSGLMEWSKTNNADDHPPFPIPGGGDHPTGLSLFTSILLALINREKTGEGTTVSTSLLANGIWSNAMLVQAILSGHEPINTFYWDNLSALRNIYLLRDNSKFFMLLTNEEKYWNTLLNKLNIEHLNNDNNFNTEDKRQINRKLLKIELQKAFKKYTFPEIKEKLLKTGIIFTKINKIEETIHDKQAIMNDMFMPIKGEIIKNLKVVAPPINIKNVRRKKANKAPKLGEHNVEILKELGYSPKEIKKFQVNKIIL